MTDKVQVKKGRLDWLFQIEAIAFMGIMAYYVVAEHREHLLEYANYLLFGVFVLLFGITLWHFRTDTTTKIKEEKHG